MNANDSFARALEGFALTEAEVARMWAEAPVTKLSPADYDALVAELERPARELPKLRALVDRVWPEGFTPAP